MTYYWAKLLELLEERAQDLAANYSQRLADLHRTYVRRIDAEVDALYAQILDSGAESVTRSQLYQYSRYETVRKQITGNAADLQTRQRKMVEATIRKVYEDTLGTTMDALVGSGQWSLSSKQLITQYLATPWSGELYSKRIWRNANKLASDLQQHIGDMIILGRTPGDVKKQVMRDHSVSYEMADRLIRTEASAAYNTAALTSYSSAGLEKVKFRAEISGACERCRTYALEQNGIYTLSEAPHIPVHPRCRCLYVPVVDLKEERAKIKISMLEAAKKR